MESVADGAHDTADAVEEAARQDQIREDRLALQSCQVRNTAQSTTRGLFVALFDTVERLGVEPETLDELRAIIPDPVDVDRDCDGDGLVDESDYNPD